MSSYRLHKIFWYAAAQPLGRIFLATRFRVRHVFPSELPDHYLMISNHVTNYDPILIGLAVKRHTYFVASEHILNKGLTGKLLRFFLDPIARPKGAAGAGAVMEILRRLRAKKSVVLFAEGNCSWDGRAIPVPEATGKTVRASGAPLVTCRIRGGYFSHPRWAYTNRKGPLTVEIIHIYQPDELKGKKPEEINALINADIGEDAYAAMAAEPFPYKGKKLAKGIEHTLVLCPQCRRFNHIRSRNDRFFCDCGLEGRFDSFGRLSGSGFAFDSIPAWFDWQKEAIAALPKEETETVYTSDPLLILNRICGGRRTEITRGSVSFSNLRLSVGDLVFPLSDITDMAVRLHGVVSFSLKNGDYYELMAPGKKNYSGLKYKLLYDHFA